MPNEASAPEDACQSVTEVTRRHGLELLRFAYLLCGDRHVAEDLLQDVLFAMHRRFPGDLTLDNPVGYARRAIANRKVSRIRRSASSEIVVDLRPDRPMTLVDDTAERDPLWQALRRLPERQRTARALRFYVDATDEDIAETLGCRRGTVRSLASRGLAALRDDPTLGPITSDGGAR